MPRRMFNICSMSLSGGGVIRRSYFARRKTYRPAVQEPTKFELVIDRKTAEVIAEPRPYIGPSNGVETFGE